MSLCLATAAIAITLSLPTFTLRWEHSVEKTAWEERWRAGPEGLVLEEARIKGSGAGMEPPDDAELVGGWWTYPGHMPPQRRIRLAVSSATRGGWQICTPKNVCRANPHLHRQPGHQRQPEPHRQPSHQYQSPCYAPRQNPPARTRKRAK